MAVVAVDAAAEVASEGVVVVVHSPGVGTGVVIEAVAGDSLPTRSRAAPIPGRATKPIMPLGSSLMHSRLRWMITPGLMEGLTGDGCQSWDPPVHFRI